MATTLCNVCGTIGLGSGGDGFFYCLTCGTQSQDLVEQGMEDDGMVFNGVYKHSYRRKTQNAPVQSQAEIDMQTQAEALARMQKANMTSDQVLRAEWNADSDDETLVVNRGFQQNDALDAETLAFQLRERYLEGMQMMIQMQCEALVKKFGVSPLICGVFAPIWLHFVASTRVFERGWANEALLAADALYEEREQKKRKRDGPNQDFEDINRPISKYKRSKIFKEEPRTSLYGKKARNVWASSLKERIPLAISLAISFLACHIAREVVLPTDMIKWALEGNLPYLAAFVDIENSLSGVSKPWPLSPKRLFMPNRMIGARRLELMSGRLAKRIGLELPPVNFHSISCRFLERLGFPVNELFPALSRIYEWLSPPCLWLSAETNAIPTYVYVMAILVVVIRILYNIHGQGYWEKSVSDNTLASGSCDKNYNGDFSQDQIDRISQGSTDSCVNDADVGNDCFDIHLMEKVAGETPVSSSGNITHFQDQELDATTMLQNLETRVRDNSDGFDYGKDLFTYMKYCNEVIFAGSKMSYEDENMVKHFWKLYEKLEKEDLDPIHEAEGDTFLDLSINNTRYNSIPHSMDENNVGLCQPDCEEILSAGELECSKAGVKQEIKSTSQNISLRGSPGFKKNGNRNLESIISDMEQNGFHYIHPARHHPPDIYLSYRKKNINRKLETFVHADYYILLRACARVVKVKAHALHSCVLRVEKRLSWIEDRVAGVLQKKMLT